MGFRFQRLATVYPNFSDRFLRDNRDYHALSYQQHYHRFVSTRYAESDAYAVHMARLGNPSNNAWISIEPLQKQWAIENNVSYDRRKWLTDIALAQVEAFKPDVLYLDDLYTVDEPFRRQIRARCGDRVMLIGWRAAPTNDYGQFSDLDLMLTSMPTLAEGFRAAGISFELLHHGFDVDVLSGMPEQPARDVDFSFAGGLGPLHPERTLLIESLIDRSPLEVWGVDRKPSWKDRFRWWLARAGVPQKAKVRSRAMPLRYPSRVHPSVFGTEYLGLLARSKIVLNSHIACTGDDATNMRMFEATGMGACLVTDNKRNMAELFEPDREVVTYDSVHECVDVVEYLLNNDDEREQIAAAGQLRTIESHSVASRVAKMAQMFEANLARRAA